MSTAVTIAKREMASYFRTPSGWIIIALYLFLTGGVFAYFVLNPGGPAGLRPFFTAAGWLLLPVVPAISMRLISEELRTGTIEALLSAPVGSASLVLGKFLGALGFLSAMVLPTGIYAAILGTVSNAPIDAGPVASGYFCLLLLGVLFLAIGVFTSSLTSNGTLAFMSSLFTIVALMLLPAAADAAPSWATPALLAIALPAKIADFAKGVIDARHVLFFVSMTAWFLLLAVVAMDVRRWR